MIPAENDRSGFVVRNINADFLATSTLGELLTVTSKIVTVKSTSLVLLQEIWREEKKLFSMEILMVYIDNGRPKRIPEVFKELFKNF